MTQQDNGGAAFPLHPGIMPDWKASAGMTLREWFAGQAPDVPAWFGKMTDVGQIGTFHGTAEQWLIARQAAAAANVKIVASWGYAYADAMLAARSANAD